MCDVVATLGVAELLPPVITAATISVLFSKDIGVPTAGFFLFWYVATYFGFYFEGSVEARVEFLLWPLAIFAVALAFSAFLSQIGDYPRLWDYAHVMRTLGDAASRLYDRRRTAWEGLILVLSLFSIYLGALFVAGNLSDGCLLVPLDTAWGVGAALILAGIAGIAALVLVTIFSNMADNIERRRFWKYTIWGLFGIAGHVLMHDLLYAYARPTLGIWYGLIALIPLLIFWIVLYWWIRDVHFYNELNARAALKALGDQDESQSRLVALDTLDGLKTPEILTAFIVTGALYNVLGVVLAWAVSALTLSALWTFVAVIVFTAVAIIIIIILAWLTNVYTTVALAGAAGYSKV